MNPEYLRPSDPIRESLDGDHESVRRRVLRWLKLLAATYLILNLVPVFAVQHLDIKAQIGGAIMGDFVVEDDLAYVFMGNTLAVMDFSDPKDPKIIGRTERAISYDWNPKSCGPYKMAKVGDFIIMHGPGQVRYHDDRDRPKLDAGSGLFVVDVSNPQNPRRVSAHLPVGASQVTADGHRFYALQYRSQKGIDGAERVHRLYVFKLARSGQATILGKIDFEDNVDEIAARENLLALISWESGLQSFDLMDLTDLNTPKLVSQTPLRNEEGKRASPFNEVHLIDDYAYLLQSTGHWHVYDISNPKSPALVTKLRHPGLPESGSPSGDSTLTGELSGSLLVMTQRDANLHLMDISDPRNPEFISQGWFPDHRQAHFAVSRSRIYLSSPCRYDEPEYSHDFYPGLSVFQLRDGGLKNTGYYSTFSPEDVEVLDEKLAMVAAGSRGLYLMSLENPGKPVLELVPNSDRGVPIAIQQAGDGYIVQIGSKEFLWYDAPDDPEPELIQSLLDAEEFFYAKMLAASERYLVLASAIADEGYGSWRGYPEDRTRFNQAFVYDISEPTVPKLLGELKHYDLRDLSDGDRLAESMEFAVIRDDWIYLANSNTVLGAIENIEREVPEPESVGLRIYNLENRDFNPISEHNIAQIYGMVLEPQTDMLYLSGTGGVDVSDPDNPRERVRHRYNYPGGWSSRSQPSLRSNLWESPWYFLRPWQNWQEPWLSDYPSLAEMDISSGSAFMLDHGDRVWFGSVDSFWALFDRKATNPFVSATGIKALTAKQALSYSPRSGIQILEVSRGPALGVR